MDESLYKGLLAGGPSLKEDEFTKQGESIPSDANVLDFIRYNLAHVNPVDLAMQMGTSSGGIKPVGSNLYSALTSASSGKPIKGIYVAPQYEDLGVAKHLTTRIPTGGSKSIPQVEYKALKGLDTPDYLVSTPSGGLVSSSARPEFYLGKPNTQVHLDESGAPVVRGFDMGNYTELVPEYSLLNSKRHWEEVSKDPGPAATRFSTFLQGVDNRKK